MWTHAFVEANERLQAMIQEETEAFQAKLQRAQQLLCELSEFPLIPSIAFLSLHTLPI